MHFWHLPTFSRVATAFYLFLCLSWFSSRLVCVQVFFSLFNKKEIKVKKCYNIGTKMAKDTVKLLIRCFVII